ncbi:MAG: hypothetical protein ACRDPI_10375 [Nocardioidaceae bacterium]
MKIRILAPAVLTTLTLALTGCGGSGGGGESAGDAAAAKAISAAMLSGSGANGAGFTVNKTQADCVGKGFVDKVGTDNLEKYGLLSADGKAIGSVTGLKMSHRDASAAAGVMIDCTDAAKMLSKAMGSQAGALDPTTKACLVKILTPANVRALYTGIFEGDEQGAAQRLTTPLLKCVGGALPSL